MTHYSNGGGARGKVISHKYATSCETSLAFVHLTWFYFAQIRTSPSILNENIYITSQKRLPRFQVEMKGKKEKKSISSPEWDGRIFS